MNNRRITLYIFAGFVLLFGIYRVFFSNHVPAGASLEPNEFEQKMKEQGAVILDVRSAFEFGGDKIQGQKISVILKRDLRKKLISLIRTQLTLCIV